MQEQAGKQAENKNLGVLSLPDQTDNIFRTVLLKKGCNPDYFKPVFEKCKWDFVKLYGDEYYIGHNLEEYGLMETKRKPIWKNGSYAGTEVFFKSVTFKN